MRTRITVNQLTTPLLISDVEKAMAYLYDEIRKLSELNPQWLAFFREKSSQAIETLSFILKQKVAMHEQGYPSKNKTYLTRIERQLRNIKSLYCAFFKHSPGLILEMHKSAPEVFVWLMLEPEFGDHLPHLLLAFYHLEAVDEDMATMLILHSNVSQLDSALAALIYAFPDWAQQSFICMTFRHSLSIGLAKHSLRKGKLNEEDVLPVLAMLDVEEGRQWVNEHATENQYLFERLLYLQNRKGWFGQYLNKHPQAQTSPNFHTFITALELHAWIHFDPHTENAPIELALNGRLEWVIQAFDHIKTCQNEQEVEPWLYAFYIIYGERLPFHPKDLGLYYTWNEAIVALDTWRESDAHRFTKSMRLGAPLSYATTLCAMKDPYIPASFRKWIWYQLCLHARVFVFWDVFMPHSQQEDIFTKLEALSYASSRFDQRDTYTQRN